MKGRITLEALAEARVQLEELAGEQWATLEKEVLRCTLALRHADTPGREREAVKALEALLAERMPEGLELLRKRRELLIEVLEDEERLGLPPLGVSPIAPYCYWCAGGNGHRVADSAAVMVDGLLVCLQHRDEDLLSITVEEAGQREEQLGG